MLKIAKVAGNSFAPKFRGKETKNLIKLFVHFFSKNDLYNPSEFYKQIESILFPICPSPKPLTAGRG